MSKIEVNQIGPQCGTTLTVGCGAGQTVNIDANTVTLGRCGATVQLAAGASQSGFGRSGSVNWDTTAKTAGFTAVSGNGYFVNTTSGVITVTLPATPSAGDIVSISDYAQTSGSNNITVARNGSNIEGDASDLTIANDGISLTFVYVDGTKGWKVVGAGQEANKDPSVPAFVTATGGTVSCCGDYKIHTFTGPGTFTVTCAGNSTGSSTVDYLVVAGGGGAGGGHWTGGGGGGGFRESVPSPAAWTASPLANPGGALPVTATAYPITIGSGGSGGSGNPGSTDGGKGNDSIFSTITSTGGGFSENYSATGAGPSGGSGGGGTANTQTGGAGNTPPVSPPQGNPGGNSTGGGGGGGGGAGAAGQPQCGAGPSFTPKAAGVATLINGSPVTYSEGGRGHGYASTPSPDTGAANTGDGGSGSSTCSGDGPGGAGGSGIVIIRYKYQ